MISLFRNRVRIDFWKPCAIDFQIYIKTFGKKIGDGDEWLLFRFMLGIYTNYQSRTIMSK